MASTRRMVAVIAVTGVAVLVAATPGGAVPVCADRAGRPGLSGRVAGVGLRLVAWQGAHADPFSGRRGPLPGGRRVLVAAVYDVRTGQTRLGTGRRSRRQASSSWTY
jgi:hypothetical protein